MKVAHLDEQLGWRGGEQQASWLIQGIAREGLDVFLIGRANSAFLENPHGDVALEKVALPLKGEWDLWSAWKISRLILKEEIDILHAHTGHMHTLAILARRFAGRGKVVASRRVSFPPRGGLFMKWKYHAPDRLLAVSEKVGEVLIAHGIPAAKVTVVHSSVNEERLRAPAISRESLGLPAEAPLLVNAGALVGHKDQATLLEAFQVVLGAYPEARLCIAGEGALRTQLEAQIKDLGLQGAVQLLGQRKDAPALIRAADLYVSSSWSEGLGTSILEALALKVPVVATEAGGAREMVIPGRTGHLVPCRDAQALSKAIQESLRDRAQAYTMAEEGLRLIEREFSAQTMVARSLEVYKGLLN